MAKVKTKIEVSPEVESLFHRIEEFVQSVMQSPAPPLKIQVEKDFRGKPVISVRVRKEDVEPELMTTLRYPEG